MRSDSAEMIFAKCMVLTGILIIIGSVIVTIGLLSDLDKTANIGLAILIVGGSLYVVEVLFLFIYFLSL